MSERLVGVAIREALRTAKAHHDALVWLSPFAKPLCAQPAKCILLKRGGRADERCDSCRARDALTHAIPRALEGG